jgi:ferric-dicitrate binding protein FerR (iron transport regulator)
MDNEKLHTDSIDETLIAYISGSATADERQFVLQWLNAKEENKAYFENIRKVYLATELSKSPSGFQKEAGWSRIKAGYYKGRFQKNAEEQSPLSRKGILRMLLPAAAAVVFAFLLGFWFRGTKDTHVRPTVAYNQIDVPLGARTHLMLSDGTKVWLNAGSKFRYPSDFSGEKREVYLEGEGFFDVTHLMGNQLFLVKTSNLDVRVYGTQFNVKAYPGENKISTTLVKGSVAIESHNKSEKPVYLKPNETATYFTNDNVSYTNNNTNNKKDDNNSQQKIIVESEINSLPVISWKDAKWVIEAEELGGLAVKFERRYNVKIAFAKEELKRYKFSGTLTDETFEQVLKIVQISAPIIYTIKNNRVTFYEDSAYRKKYDKLIRNN